MTIQQSNLQEHKEFALKLGKKLNKGMSCTEIVGHTTDQVLVTLVMIPHVGLNPYKQVEMFQIYHPSILVKFHLDESCMLSQLRTCGQK